MHPKKRNKRDLERFWAKVHKNGSLVLTSRCWEWSGYRDVDGYGTIWKSGTNAKAHRVSFEINVGPIANGLFVCHRCDNPPCVNPDHLFLGSALENKRDCLHKGRLNPALGESHGQSRLTIEQVLDIRSRAAYRGLTVNLAKEFGVHHMTISLIRNRKKWRHV